MNRNYVLIFASVVMLLSSCAPTPTKDIVVDVQADPKANLSGYKTYAWFVAAAIVNDRYGQWEPPAFDADAEIKHLIDRELRKRSMSQSSPLVYPDVIVAFAAGIDMDALELKVDPKSKIEWLANVPRGGLVIALIDGESGFIIWAGVATAKIQQSPTAKTVKARLDYAVTQLFQKLPE